MPASPDAGGAWAVLKSHGKSLASILNAWDDDNSGEASRSAFIRAARALGALQLCSRVPSDIELDSMFDVLAGANKDVRNISELLKQPLEPQTFEVIEDEPFDPDTVRTLGRRAWRAADPPRAGSCSRAKSAARQVLLARVPAHRLAPGPQESCCSAPDALARHDRRPSAVLPILSEFHSARPAFACLSRLGSLDPDECSLPLAASRPSSRRCAAMQARGSSSCRATCSSARCA